MRMDYECYHLERVEDHILIVMMDRPEVANAKNTAMGLEQKEIFENLYTDTDGVRCVILTGRGDKAFCAGGDLKERKGMTDAQYADLLRVVSTAAKTNHLVTGLQVPVDPEFDSQ